MALKNKTVKKNNVNLEWTIRDLENLINTQKDIPADYFMMLCLAKEIREIKKIIYEKERTKSKKIGDKMADEKEKKVILHRVDYILTRNDKIEKALSTLGSILDPIMKQNLDNATTATTPDCVDPISKYRPSVMVEKLINIIDSQTSILKHINDLIERLEL